MMESKNFIHNGFSVTVETPGDPIKNNIIPGQVLLIVKHEKIKEGIKIILDPILSLDEWALTLSNGPYSTRERSIAEWLYLEKTYNAITLIGSLIKDA